MDTFLYWLTYTPAADYFHMSITEIMLSVFTLSIVVLFIFMLVKDHEITKAHWQMATWDVLMDMYVNRWNRRRKVTKERFYEVLFGRRNYRG